MGGTLSKKNKKIIRARSYLEPKKLARELGVSEEQVRRYMKSVGLTPALKDGVEKFSLPVFIDKHAFWIIFSLVLAYAVYLSAVTLIKYFTYANNDFDLAIYVQFFDNTLRGRIAYTSIVGSNLFKWHQCFSMFLFVPIYAVLPYPWILLVLQSIWIGAAAFPIYFLGKRALSKSWGLLFAFVYILYPAKTYINLFEFHPSSLAIVLLLTLFYFWYAKNWKWFLVFMVLTLLTREDLALQVFMFGFAGAARAKLERKAIFRKENIKWILVPSLCGLVYFFFCTKIVAPYFSEGEYVYQSLFKDWGSSFGEVIINVLKNPFAALQYMLSSTKVSYLVALLLPVAFLSLFSPLTLLIVLPAFSANLLTSMGTPATIYFQYTSYPAAFIFASAVLGAKRLISIRQTESFSKFIGLVIIAFALISAFVFGPVLWPKTMFTGLDKNAYKNQASRPRHLEPGIGDQVPVYDSFKEKIPKDVPISTTFRFLNHLAQREEVESAHYLFMQRDNLTEKQYQLPEHIEYGLFDMQDRILNWFPYDAGRNVSEIFGITKPVSNWGIVDYLDDIVLFKKGYNSNIRMVEINPEQEPKIKINAVFKNGLSLVGSSMKVKKNEDGFRYLALDIFTRLSSTQQGRLSQYFLVQTKLTRAGYPIMTKKIRPLGTYFYATPFWPINTTVVERIRILLPTSLTHGTYGVDIIFCHLQLYPVKTGGVVADLRNIKGLMPSGGDTSRYFKGWIKLGEFEIVK